MICKNDADLSSVQIVIDREKSTADSQSMLIRCCIIKIW